MKAFSANFSKTKRFWWRPGSWSIWFRIFGYGIAISNMPSLFSERYGYKKTFRLLGVKIKALKP